MSSVENMKLIQITQADNHLLFTWKNSAQNS